jgi:hypothetical protein
LDQVLLDATAAGVVHAVATGSVATALANAYLQESFGVVFVVGGVTQTLADTTLAGALGIFTPMRFNATLDGLGTNLRGGVEYDCVVRVTLDDIGVRAFGITPIFCALTQTLGNSGFAANAAAYATSTLNGTLNDVVLVSSGKAPVAGGVDAALSDLGLVTDVDVIVNGKCTAQLDDAVLEMVGQGMVAGYLSTPFDDMVLDGYALHVRRTPILHAFVYVHYVVAEVRAEVIYATATADVIHAVTIVEDEKKVA